MSRVEDILAQGLHRAVASVPGASLMDNLYVEPSRRRFANSLQRPHDAQQQIFDFLLARGRRTHFGRDHGFAHIRTPSDYQSAVPVRRYEDLKPYVDRAIAAEVDVLWPGRVDWFLESSGTSGRKKQIPLPREAWQRLYQPTGATYMAQLLTRAKDRRRFLRGKTVFFGGGLHPDPAHPLRIFGDVTAFGIHLLPWYLGFSRAPGKEIALIPNWEERLHRMAQATLQEDVVHLAGLPTWLRHFGAIVLAMTGKANLREVWPNLMAATVGGVNPTPYFRDLNRLILGRAENEDAGFFYSEVYNGTEGFYALQIDEDDMVLMPDASIFYEFVPTASARNGDFSPVVFLADVAVGVEYAPVISSVNGLWRYLIGDTVRFTSVDPYRLVVSGRVNAYLNISGEELLVDSTDAAVQAVTAAFDLTVNDYMVVAQKEDGMDDNARHLWLLEVAHPVLLDPTALAAALDQFLIDNHYDYAKSRRGGALSGASFGLSTPCVHFLPAGTFQRWLHRRLDGKVGAQSKVPRLSMDATVVEEVLGLGE
ncbi:hypothetical protein GC175_00750 [bacterium]|nr:hypothetical protein [bacterium]